MQSSWIIDDSFSTLVLKVPEGELCAKFKVSLNSLLSLLNTSELALDGHTLYGEVFLSQAPKNQLSAKLATIPDNDEEMTWKNINARHITYGENEIKFFFENLELTDLVQDTLKANLKNIGLSFWEGF